MSDDTLLDNGSDDAADPTPVYTGDETTGTFERELIDSNSDGVFDAVFVTNSTGANLVVMDLDGDTSADGLVVDANGDGVADVWIVKDGDGFRIEVDRDGDGVSDDSQTVTRDQLLAVAPDFVELLDTRFDGAPVDGAVDGSVDTPIDGSVDTPVDGGIPDDVSPDGDLVVDGQLIGDPEDASEHWFQQAQNGFCLPASIAQIVSEYTGVHYVDEAQFVDLANEHGAFSVGMDGVPGIEFAKGAELMQAAGVPARYEFGDMESLATDLSEGRGVIVFVDSGEYWNGESTEDNAPDHAVVVTAIDLERQTVTLSDPGTPGGDQEELPLGLFENAWADSNHAMIVCDEPAPDAAPVDGVPVDGVPADGAPVEGVPVEGAPVDVAPLETGLEDVTPAPLGADGQPIDGRPDPVTGLDDVGSEAVSESIHKNGWVLLPFLSAVALGRTRS
ncbi:C39 family peptidase [Terrabacter sp. GCM10028922]|uniref:C39 family peptidase n=1 Tax=Terrabacter sp. GCM10028922 TaxID=3273428 RepID=UPI0036173097